MTEKSEVLLEGLLCYPSTRRMRDPMRHYVTDLRSPDSLRSSASEEEQEESVARRSNRRKRREVFLPIPPDEDARVVRFCRKFSRSWKRRSSVCWPLCCPHGFIKRRQILPERVRARQFALELQFASWSREQEHFLD
jgi:hypothetical protein